MFTFSIQTNDPALAMRLVMAAGGGAVPSTPDVPSTPVPDVPQVPTDTRTHLGIRVGDWDALAAAYPGVANVREDETVFENVRNDPHTSGDEKAARVLQKWADIVDKVARQARG